LFDFILHGVYVFCMVGATLRFFGHDTMWVFHGGYFGSFYVVMVGPFSAFMPHYLAYLCLERTCSISRLMVAEHAAGWWFQLLCY
jgi:hypothetical protein